MMLNGPKITHLFNIQKTGPLFFFDFCTKKKEKKIRVLY